MHLTEEMVKRIHGVNWLYHKQKQASGLLQSRLIGARLYNATAGLNQTSIANPDLQWENRKKFNVGIDGEFKKRLGYNVNYRWQQGFVYEFPFDVGPIDNIGTLDASVSYKLPKAKSTIQIGGSNLTNAYNTQIWGGPQLGRMIFAGILVDIK